MSNILTVNGIPIPVAADSLAIATVETGDLAGDVFSLNGQALRSRTYLRRTITGKTVPIPYDQAAALRRQIYGIGHKFGFDTPNLISSRGVLPTGVNTYQPTLAADGTPATLESPTLSYVYAHTTQYPGGALAVDRAHANLAPSNVSTGSDTAGSVSGAWTTTGAGTIASDTTRYVSGSRSIALTASGTGTNVFKSATFTGPVAGQRGQASAYVRGVVGSSMTMALKDGNGTVLAISNAGDNANIAQDSWLRILAPSNGVNCTLAAGSYLEIDLTGYASAINIDQVFAEQVTSSTGYPVSWVDGTLAAGGASYAMPAAGMLGSTDLGVTVSFWATQPPASATMLRLSSAANINMYPLFVTLFSTPSTLQLQYGGAVNGTAPFSPYAPFVHFAVTITPAGVATLYANGTQIAQRASGVAIDASQFDTLTFGAGTFMLDDVTVWPFVLRQSDIAAVAASTNPVGQLPFVTVAGDILGAVPLTCTGKVTKAEYVSAYVQGGFATRHREVEFEFEEY